MIQFAADLYPNIFVTFVCHTNDQQSALETTWWNWICVTIDFHLLRIVRISNSLLAGGYTSTNRIFWVFSIPLFSVKFLIALVAFAVYCICIGSIWQLRFRLIYSNSNISNLYTDIVESISQANQWEVAIPINDNANFFYSHEALQKKNLQRYHLQFFFLAQ